MTWEANFIFWESIYLALENQGYCEMSDKLADTMVWGITPANKDIKCLFNEGKWPLLRFYVGQLLLELPARYKKEV